MADLIKREDAIDALRLIPADLGCRELDDAINTIMLLPSAQPERKKGQWLIDDGESYSYYCSNCGKHAYGALTEIMMGEYKFCPNCGAEMEKDGE